MPQRIPSGTLTLVVRPDGERQPKRKDFGIEAFLVGWIILCLGALLVLYVWSFFNG